MSKKANEKTFEFFKLADKLQLLGWNIRVPYDGKIDDHYIGKLQEIRKDLSQINQKFNETLKILEIDEGIIKPL